MTTYEIDSSVNNIAATFGSGAGSKMGPFSAGETLIITTSIDSKIWIGDGDSSTPVTTLATNPSQLPVLASSVSPGLVLHKLTSNNQYYYVRSDSGTLSTGKVSITVV